MSTQDFNGFSPGAHLRVGQKLSVADVPIADHILHCASQIIYRDPDYPGLGGTCFALRLDGKLVFLSAGHVVADCEPDAIGIPVAYGGGLEFVDLESIARPAIRDPDDPDWLDFAMLVPRGNVLPEDAHTVIFEPEWLVEMRESLPRSIFALSGYPRDVAAIDYEGGQISTTLFLTPAFYGGATDWAWCHKLICDEAYDHSMDGMSGGPVVKLEHDGNGNWRAAFAGMLLRGGGRPTSFYFVDGLVLASAIRSLER